jgi:citrate synthase
MDPGAATYDPTPGEKISPRELATYLLSVSRMSSSRASEVAQATTLEQVRQIQYQHECQMAAFTGMMCASASQGMLPWEYDPEAMRPGFWARLRWVLFYR